MNEEFEKFLVEFVKWIKLKVRIHISDDTLLLYKTREIWWANVGLNIGSEQNGKNKNFDRPVLILKKFGKDIFWAIPLTSNKENKTFPYKFSYIHRSKNVIGELIEEDKTGFLILNQLKAMSSKRLIRKVGVIPNDSFEAIKGKIKEML
ncbi:MAG: type II toxin-antitoxin system PemK/MazF family toxin [Patescibacteria group bacterium]|nr:type II toxin-antitoxin system PemK/MazF family toxin [Patescibacteria group bacterium]